ncbi:MAG: LptF/LptG family permease [Myxococcota bacterium]
MRVPRTIIGYVLREVLLYTLIGLAAIILVLVTRNLIRALEDLVDAGFTAGDLLLVVRLLGTMLVIYALPISFLFGVLLAIGRMAADVEITAMRACGIGLRTFTLPILCFGLLFSACTWQLTIESEPAARRMMQTAMKAMLARGGVIEPGKFRRFGGNRLFYVEDRDKQGRLRGIVISDRSNPERPFMVFARSGAISLDEERGEIVVRLETGDIHVEAERGEDRYQRIAFEQFDYSIDVASILGESRRRRAKEMTMEELGETIARIHRGDTHGLRDEPVEYEMHWHRRLATPFAPALFGLVAVPIAMRRTRGARSMGMIWCAALGSGYYVMQTSFEFLAAEGALAPSVAPWVPNAVFLVIGIVLLARARNAGM